MLARLCDKKKLVTGWASSLQMLNPEVSLAFQECSLQQAPVTFVWLTEGRSAWNLTQAAPSKKKLYLCYSVPNDWKRTQNAFPI